MTIIILKEKQDSNSESLQMSCTGDNPSTILGALLWQLFLYPLLPTPAAGSSWEEPSGFAYLPAVTIGSPYVALPAFGFTTSTLK
jgi:hypothetical protein